MGVLEWERVFLGWLRVFWLSFGCSGLDAVVLDKGLYSGV